MRDGQMFFSPPLHSQYHHLPDSQCRLPENLLRPLQLHHGTLLTVGMFPAGCQSIFPTLLLQFTLHPWHLSQGHSGPRLSGLLEKTSSQGSTGCTRPSLGTQVWETVAWKPVCPAAP